MLESWSDVFGARSEEEATRSADVVPLTRRWRNHYGHHRLDLVISCYRTIIFSVELSGVLREVVAGLQLQLLDMSALCYVILINRGKYSEVNRLSYTNGKQVCTSRTLVLCMTC